MAEIITDETIDYVGILAKLNLSDEEKEQAKKDMTQMLGFFEQLQQLNTDDVEPMSHILPLENVFREDVVTNEDGSADTLKNAPGEKDNMIIVPKTFD